MRFFFFNRAASQNHLSQQDNERPFFASEKSTGGIDRDASFFGSQDGIRSNGFFSPVQTKMNAAAGMTIGSPGDLMEKEADRMADRVVSGFDRRGTDLGANNKGGDIVQAKCTECEQESPGHMFLGGNPGTVRKKPAFESEEDRSDGIQAKCEACEEEEKNTVQTKDNDAGNASANAKSSGRPGPMVGPGLSENLQSAIGQGSPLPEPVKGIMESSFGTDFSRVRIHTGSRSVQMNKDLHALAFTHGSDIFFNQARFDPGSDAGRHLLAHELTHVVQQQENDQDRIDMACLGSPPCPAVGSSTPIPGSAEDFGEQEEIQEAGPRGRRKGMTCSRATSTTHAGRARQLEILLNAHDPGTMANIHGIFLDADLSSGTGAMITKCDGADGWEGFALPAGCTVPAFAGASKPCVFVHGNLNQEAFRFNNTADAVIGGLPREDWRLQTLQTLIHEAQHAVFDTSIAGRAAPAGAAGCPRSTVMAELTELNAIMSEFPILFRSVPAAAGPARTHALSRLNNWFTHAITNPHESLSGTVRAMRCTCDCAEVDAHIRDIFNFVSTTWTAAEKNAFNTELRKPIWNVHPFELNWPL
jgi:hypothetical protein